jgi:hypothetical protein
MFAHFAIKKEQKRLASGWTYEPRMSYEKNAKALELEALAKSKNKTYPPPQGAFIPHPARNVTQTWGVELPPS